MILLLVFISGCQQPYQLDIDFAVNREQLRFTKAEKQAYFMVYSKTAWTIDFETPVDWAILSRTSGEGNCQVMVTCLANSSISRGTNIIITSSDGRTARIYLSQEAGQNGSYKLEKDDVSLLSKGAAISVGAETNIPEHFFEEAAVTVEYPADSDWIRDITVTSEGLTCTVNDYQGEESRQAVVTVSFPAAEWDTKKCTASLTIRQSAVLPQITVTDERRLDAKGCVDALVPLEFNWAAEYYAYSVADPSFEGSPAWITGSFDVESQSIKVTAQKNDTEQVRQAIMSFFIEDADGNAVGTPVSVTLIQDVFVSVDPSKAVPLYEGEKYANCYVVDETVSRLYQFDAKKNNGDFPSEQMDSAAVLWQNVPCPIDTAFYQNEMIYFKTKAGETGNAVIAVFDQDEQICWSWHIWVTGEPIGTNTFANSKVFMDRNLGAYKSASEYTMIGTFYQGGRKDPFPAASQDGDRDHAVVYPQDVIETLTEQDGKSSEWVSAHPAVYIWGDADTGKQDWLDVQNNNLWAYNASNPKRVNDPCPYGYRVPLNTDMNSSGATFQNILDTAEQKGIFLTLDDQLGKEASFPLGGTGRSKESTSLYVNVGEQGWLWCGNGTTMSAETGTGFYRLQFKPLDATFGGAVPRRRGANVRCIKMDI